MAISALGSRLDGHRRASSTAPAPISSFPRPPTHTRTLSSTPPAPTAGLQGRKATDCSELTEKGRERGELHPSAAKSNRKRDFLGVLDAAISYFAGAVTNSSAEIPEFKADKSPISALKAHFQALKSENQRLLKTKSTLQSQHSLYTTHISSLSATLQSLQVQLSSPTNSLSLPEGEKAPRRTIDSPQGYSESPYIRPDMYSRHIVSRLPVLLSSAINFS